MIFRKLRCLTPWEDVRRQKGISPENFASENSGYPALEKKFFSVLRRDFGRCAPQAYDCGFGEKWPPSKIGDFRAIWRPPKIRMPVVTARFPPKKIGRLPKRRCFDRWRPEQRIFRARTKISEQNSCGFLGDHGPSVTVAERPQRPRLTRLAAAGVGSILAAGGHFGEIGHIFPHGRNIVDLKIAQHIGLRVSKGCSGGLQDFGALTILGRGTPPRLPQRPRLVRPGRVVFFRRHDNTSVCTQREECVGQTPHRPGFVGGPILVQRPRLARPAVPAAPLPPQT